MNERRISSLNGLFFLTVSIACISWNISGLVSAIPGVRGMMMLIIEGLCILSYFTMPRYKDINFSNIIILYLISSISVYVYQYITGYNSDSFNWFSMVFPFSFLFIGKILIDNVKIGNFIFKFLLFDVIIKFLVTMTVYPSNPTVMKEAVLGYANASGIMHLVIQYGFVYLLPVFVILSYSCAMEEHFQKSKRIRWGCFLTFLLIILFLSQMTMQIFLVPVMLVLFHIYKKNGTLSRVIIPVAIIAIALWLFLPRLLQMMINSGVFGSAVELRLSGILKVLSGGSGYVTATFTGNMSEGDTVVNRIAAYQMSIEAAINNFWVGYASKDFVRSGGHSTWIDFIANFGIGISILIYYLFVKSYRWIKKQYNEYVYEIDIIFIYLVLAGVVSNISVSNIFLSLYILIPVFINYKRKLMRCHLSTRKKEVK